MDLAVSEAGLMEQSQNIVLLAAAIIFLLAACRSRAVDRAVGVNAGLLCGLLFFREIEFLPTAPFASYLSSQAFRLHEALVALAILVPYSLVRWRLVPELFRYALSRRAWPFQAAAVGLLIGYGFDKYGVRYLDLPVSKFWEELAECISYFILMLAAGMLLRARTYAPYPLTQIVPDRGTRVSFAPVRSSHTLATLLFSRDGRASGRVQEPLSAQIKQ